jgi:hypothetical protein
VAEEREIGSRCPACDQRHDASDDRDTYHDALFTHIRELAEADARIALLEQSSVDCATELDAANARAEAEEHRADMAHADAVGFALDATAAESESAALRAELVKSQAHAKFAEDEHGKADAECESLRAEVERRRHLEDAVGAVELPLAPSPDYRIVESPEREP